MHLLGSASQRLCASAQVIFTCSGYCLFGFQQAWGCSSGNVLLSGSTAHGLQTGCALTWNLGDISQVVSQIFPGELQGAMALDKLQLAAATALLGFVAIAAGAMI